MRWKKLSIYPAAIMAVATLSMVGQSCWAQSFTRIKFSDETPMKSVQEKSANGGTANSEHAQNNSQVHEAGRGCDGQAVGCSNQACDSGCSGQAVGCSGQAVGCSGQAVGCSGPACDSGCSGSGCDGMAGGQLNRFGGCGCGQRTTLRSRFGLENPIQSGPATSLRLRSRGVYCDGVCQSGCDSCHEGLFSRSGFGQSLGLLSRNSGCPDGSCGSGSGLIGRSNLGGRLSGGLGNGCPDGSCGSGSGMIGRSNLGGRLLGGLGNGCPDGSCGSGSGMIGRSNVGGRLSGGLGNGGYDGGSGTGILSGLRSRLAGLGYNDGSGDRSRGGYLLADGGGLGRRGMGSGSGFGDGYGDGLGALRNGCLDGRCGLAGCGRCRSGLLGPRRGEIPHTTQPNFAGDGMGGGGQAATFAYPYYTVRAPRDFLHDNPPTIGW